MSNKLNNILLFLLSFFACFLGFSNSKSAQNDIEKPKADTLTLSTDKPLEIRIDNFEQHLPQNILSHWEYLKLETTPECLIGKVKKILFHQNRIYVLDGEIARNLFIFDTLGHYITKIKNKGEGPNELKYVYDFYVDDDKQEIVVYDDHSSKMVHYDFELQPKYSRKTEAFIGNIRLLSDNKVLAAHSGMSPQLSNPNYTGYNLFILNNRLKLKKKGFENFDDYFQNRLTTRDCLFQFDKHSVSWIPRFKNTIFSIDSNANVSKRYHITLSDNEYSKEDYSLSTDDFFKRSTSSSKYYFIGNFVENQRYAYTRMEGQINAQKSDILVLIDKQTNKYIYGKVVPELLGKLRFSKHPVAAVGDRFVSFISIENLDYLYKKEKTLQDGKLEALYKISKIDDNPIIQFCKVNASDGLFK